MAEKKKTGKTTPAKGSRPVAKKSGAKTSTAAVRKQPPKENKPRSDKLLHQIMPFVFIALALALIVCLVSRLCGFKGEENWFGPVGEAIFYLPIFGLFGIGAFLVPAAFVYLGITWRKTVDRNKVAVKLISSFFIVLLVAALAQVFAGNNGVYLGLELWNTGAELIGGGLIGGSLGWLSYMGLHELGSVFVISILILVFVLVFIELTPKNIWTWIQYKKKLAEEKKLAALAEQEAEEEEGDEPDEDEEYYDGDEEEDAEEEDEPAEKKAPLFRIVKRREQKEEEEEKEEENAPDEAPEEPAEEVQAADEKAKKAARALEHQIMADDENDSAEVASADSQEKYEMNDTEPEAEIIPWVQPPLDLLNPDPGAHADQSENIAQTKANLRRTLESFGVRIKDIGYSIGPTITRYEVFPEAGVRVKQIANLVDDIAMSLATVGVRIEAPIPNKPAVGVEVPNAVRSNVYLKTLIDDDQFWNSSPLTVCLGQDVAGKNVYFDIKKMPHMIIAGTTGSGKSVCINGIVTSLLYKNPPDKVKLIMIDPKKVEFTMYQHIPHLYCPIISDARKAAGALASAVTEMERRYTMVEDVGVRDVDSYNKMIANDPDREYLPKLIIIIDELADLMMTAKQDVELFITRIAQKARAVGIHLILGTQRPSVDVITGLIKANVPSRIACTVKSQVDSRTIIDISGAEKLIGRGDMLYSPVGMSKPMRVQGAFLDDDEVRRVVDFIKENNEPVSYNRNFMDNMDAAAASMEAEKKSGGSDIPAGGGGEKDDFRRAVEIAVNEGKISTSLLQRKMSIGYGKAAKLIDKMQEAGYVSAPDGQKPRNVLITKQEFYEKVINEDLASEE